MNVFESINNTSNKATDIGEQYLDKTQEYIKLKVFQQVSYTVSMLGKALAIGGVLFIGLIFLAFASAISIGDAIGHVAWGYLIVGAVFVIGALVIYKTRHLIDSAIIKKIQTKIFK
ncbi:phage holin family protein [uncultured Gelidibacter sp.]|uniref:phage holin family protein n=1 Tax=uncultured Gelidibacter sp. TaxID=259318 RepID=UPI00260C5B8A|nr:phage holin family protein [uncultured Gelidibacter sp.]